MGDRRPAMLCYVLPIRPGLTVRVDLPSDLTPAEAERLSRIIHAIAIPPDENTTLSPAILRP
jgi:hypothetical protein